MDSQVKTEIEHSIRKAQTHRNEENEGRDRNHKVWKAGKQTDER